ncbi:sensor histidine kinase [Aquipuribacter nitratireducens]|uniref:histidine kinase n=1 Tax=Aquipuribacter nitratireducens TaxID=650104 RepID=A0ABW0GI07_9MICO
MPPAVLARPSVRRALAVLLPLAAVAVALVESAADQRVTALGPGSVLVALALGAGVAVAVVLPVVGALLQVALFPVPSLLLDSPGPGGAQLIVLLACLLWAGYRATVRRSAVVYGLAVLVPAVTLVVAGESAWEFLFFAVILGLGWGMGLLLRRERARSLQLADLTAQLRAERAHRERQVVEEERARISRELHDAVAHTMSVMTLQVGVVRRRLADRPVERDALAGVEDLGRRGVEELRRVVGLVRTGDADALAPAPSLSRLDDLVAELRATGTDVRVAVEGEPARSLPPALDASAFRVLQEATHNALRHAPGSPIGVVVRWDGDGLCLEVVDDGPARPLPGGSRASDGSGGHGLVGMRERVALFGGRLEAGPRRDGGFAVRASLPVPS